MGERSGLAMVLVLFGRSPQLSDLGPASGKSSGGSSPAAPGESRESGRGSGGNRYRDQASTYCVGSGRRRVRYAPKRRENTTMAAAAKQNAISSTMVQKSVWDHRAMTAASLCAGVRPVGASPGSRLAWPARAGEVGGD